MARTSSRRDREHTQLHGTGEREPHRANEDKLVALVHPDNDEAEAMGFTEEDLQNIMEQNRQELNMQLPAFCKISEIRLHEEFEKTPKKSIKRYLYRMPVLKE